ncbi:NAD(P)-dependent alcohol dehydrogenase [uncultured Oscillibacter sp.]|uniref:NAD(P)-dependent alcohol dehydrogenase n=1 Tax=uncultured Oscillibacter sp. TaxID=876091 RepID=UPI0025D378C1|nr:NAD(P)-dependent alcohol dehydrogenase [uncultured Oscillibacter sp.]
MKNSAAVMVGVKTMEIQERGMPVAGPDDVVVKIEHVGICGSDVHFFEDGRIGARLVEAPLILGHESAGVVCSTGSNVRTLQPGDRVAIEPGIPCGHCEACRSGRYNLCPEMVFRSCPPHDGMMCRYVKHPASLCFKLPGSVSTLEGAMVEPLAVAFQSAKLGGVGPNKSVAIFGSGCIGLSILLACRYLGASRAIVVDLFQSRLDHASRSGADLVINARDQDAVQAILDATDGEGCDVVFEAAGSKVTTAQTSEVVRTGGTIVIAGNPIGDIPFNFRNLTLREAKLATVWRYCNEYPKIINAIAQGKLPAKDLVTDSFPFEQVREAFDKAMYDKEHVLKAVVSFTEG